MANQIEMFCDGGSRGNPGPSAIGVYIVGLEKKYNKTLGVKTNNEAEYEAVIFGLKKLKAIIGSNKAKNTKVVVYLDSELLVNQLMGVFKVMEQRLKLLFVDVWNAKQDFKSVEFNHVKREENSMADELVNQALDAQQGELFGE